MRDLNKIPVQKGMKLGDWEVISLRESHMGVSLWNEEEEQGAYVALSHQAIKEGMGFINIQYLVDRLLEREREMGVDKGEFNMIAKMKRLFNIKDCKSSSCDN